MLRNLKVGRGNTRKKLVAPLALYLYTIYVTSSGKFKVWFANKPAPFPLCYSELMLLSHLVPCMFPAYHALPFPFLTLFAMLCLLLSLSFLNFSVKRATPHCPLKGGGFFHLAVKLWDSLPQDTVGAKRWYELRKAMKKPCRLFSATVQPLVWHLFKLYIQDAGKLLRVSTTVYLPYT